MGHPYPVIDYQGQEDYGLDKKEYDFESKG